MEGGGLRENRGGCQRACVKGGRNSTIKFSKKIYFRTSCTDDLWQLE